MLRIRSLAALAVVLALPASTALADAPWSGPVTVTRGNPQLAEPTIGFGGDGRALLSARITKMADGVPSRGFSRLFSEQADGSFSGRGRLVLAAPPALFGKTRTALLRLPLAEGNQTIADVDDPTTSLGYGFGRTDGTFEFYHRLTKRADRHSGAIAADDRGDVAAVWVEHVGGRDHLLAAQRRPNGRFGRPSVIVGSGLITSPAVALSGGGDLVVAYQHNVAGRRSVEARVRRAGHSWGRPQRLGASAGFSEIAAAAAPNGRMLVAWGTQDGGEEANQPWTIRAAMRPAGPRTFHTAQELEASQGIARPAGRAAAAIGPDGTATVAWSGIAGARFPFTYPVHTATAGSSLRFGAPQELAASGALGDVAVSRDGVTLVTWATLPEPGDNQTTDQVFAALRDSDQGAFGAPEAVSPAERAVLPRAAFDPATGRPAVVWISRPQSGSHSLRFAARG
jgi:hypothetical protein